MLAFADEAAQALPMLVTSPEFATFAATFPCFIVSEQADRLSPSLLQALQETGCQLLAIPRLQRSDAAVKPVLAASTLWLDGDWYLAPPAKPSASQVASQALALNLMQLVAADADTRDIEEVFRKDPTLAYHLLRLVNSLGMGPSRRITSFSQAILILGRQHLKRWLNLMLFSARADDYRAAMLLGRVAVRARTMESVARELGLDRSAQELAFMSGMFSLLGVLFGMPLPELFKPLHVHDALLAATLRHEGPTGTLLRTLEFFEQGNAEGLGALLDKQQFSLENFQRLNLEAHQWMLAITGEGPEDSSV